LDFDFSDEQEQLRDSVRRFLAERAPITPYVRAAYDDPVGTTDDVWESFCELGVAGLLVPVELDGPGAGLVDAAVVLEELGRALAPFPYAASALGTVSLVVDLAPAELQAEFLPGLTAGRVLASVAIDVAGAHRAPRAPTSRARSTEAGWVVTATKLRIAEGARAHVFLVPAQTDAGPCVFAVDARGPGVSVEPTPTVDATSRTATVRLDEAPGRRLDPDPDATSWAVDRTVDLLTIAACVDGVGAATRALELALEYAHERHQFGRPIGSFQAIQHLCADMLCSVELARAGAYYACWAFDGADDAERHCATVMAKAYASEVLPEVGEAAIQVFGGIGFTWEHDIHLFYKRLLTLERTLGGSDDHLDELARLTLGQ